MTITEFIRRWQPPSSVDRRAFANALAALIAATRKDERAAIVGNRKMLAGGKKLLAGSKKLLAGSKKLLAGSEKMLAGNTPIIFRKIC